MEEPMFDRDEAEAKWRAWWDSLTWRPIAEYDQALGRDELLRGEDQWALGYWGKGAPYTSEDDGWLSNDRPAWRHAQDHRRGSPLEFDPVEFALLDDDWREALFWD